MTEAVRYSDSVTVRTTPEVAQLVAHAAKAKGTRPAEYIRQALLATLQLDGFDPATIPPRDAGSLYNVRADGQRCYAWVEGDNIKAMSYDVAKPEQEGRVWLPVEHEDSEPFDIAKHWRLPPIDRIEAGRVVRVFQVVPKSWEHM